MRLHRLAVLALALGCAAEPGPGPERWSLTDGTTVELALGGPARRDEREGAVRYHLEADMVVTVQELDRTFHRSVDERGAATVARALVERIALGEREGELSRRPCAVGERQGECVAGWMTRDATRYARSGAVIETASRVVWIDVAAPGERDAEVADRAEAILSSVRVIEAGGAT